MGSGEPSVENGLHARLAGSEEIPRWNIHDHNTIINSMLCAENAEEAFYNIFGRDNRMIRYMEFIEPGAPLFVVFNDKIGKRRYGQSIIIPKWQNTIRRICKISDRHA